MIENALGSLLDAAPQLHGNRLYQRDIVDFCKTWLGGIADRQALAAINMHADKPELFGLYKIDFFETLNDIDRVMATRPEHRLSTWIGQAQAWGTTPDEKNLMERNARLQITAWDGKGVLTDYANKEWAGLTRDFLAKRWEMYFESLDSPKSKPDYLRFEVDWANSTKPPLESEAGDPAATVAAIYAKHHGEVDKLETALGASEPAGNIARHGKATDDGHSEPGGAPENAIDGDLDTYWAASPYPREWRLDLGSIRSIKTIQVFPYWGDDRYYQYTVQCSKDGNNWTLVADMSKNEKPSSGDGDTFVLPDALPARFLRITMLKNSANVGVHLVEVRVFEK